MADLRLIYSGETNTLETTTLRFNNASFIYIQNLANNLELEFDAYLQIYVSNIETRKINITSLREINILNTIDAIPIPIEYASSGLDMSIVIVSDINININVFVLIPDCICQGEFDELNDKVDEINFKQNLLLTGQAAQLAGTTVLGVNALAQNAAILALASGLGVALAPITAGTSLAIPPAVATPLIPGTTALLGAGLFLP